MFEEFTKKIKESIQNDMKDQFGLSEEESEQSTGILLDNIRDFFSENSFRGNLDQLRRSFQDWTSDHNPLKEKFNRETLQELMDKVGLNEETAAKVQDFSVNEYFKQLRSSISGLEEKLDIQGIISKIKTENLEGNARDMMDQFNKFFTRK